MGIGATVGRWWERVTGVEAGAAADQPGERKTSALPMGMGPGSVLMPFRTQGAANVLPKPTTGNLRRLAETPAARRAINCIKDRIASMEWRIEARPTAGGDTMDDRAARIQRLTAALDLPNASDSFRTLIEPVIEDILVGGFGAIEVEPGTEDRPVRLYPVDGATIQINPEWHDDPATPRYSQVTGKPGIDGKTQLLDRELIYLRL